MFFCAVLGSSWSAVQTERSISVLTALSDKRRNLLLRLANSTNQKNPGKLQKAFATTNDRCTDARHHFVRYFRCQLFIVVMASDDE